MRATFRILAAVKSRCYPEAGVPTGLTGLLTHPAPRSTLLYLYASTLHKLREEVPEHSLYRQSVESLTKHRMALVDSVVPDGYAAWKERVNRQLVELEGRERIIETAGPLEQSHLVRTVKYVKLDGRVFGLSVPLPNPDNYDPRSTEWNGELDRGPPLEGPRTLEERCSQEHKLPRVHKVPVASIDGFLEPEPLLTVEQIEELENKIGAGLIEEVIQGAENELKLVDVMVQAKIWEDLIEKPGEGQWKYFERDASWATGFAS